MKNLSKIRTSGTLFSQQKRNFLQAIIVPYLPWAFGSENITKHEKRNPFSLPIRSETQIYKEIYDKDFDESSFLEGCQEAIRVTREMMHSNDTDSLEEILTPECFSWVQRYFNSLNAADQKLKGSFHSCTSAQLSNIYMSEIDGKIHVNIVVLVELNERLMITKDDEIVWGSEEFLDRSFHIEFSKSDMADPWKISSFMAKMMDAKKMMVLEMENYQRFAQKMNKKRDKERDE